MHVLQDGKGGDRVQCMFYKTVRGGQGAVHVLQDGKDEDRVQCMLNGVTIIYFGGYKMILSNILTHNIRNRN